MFTMNPVLHSSSPSASPGADRKAFACPAWLLTILVAGYLLIMFNQEFFSTVSELHGQTGYRQLAFLGSLALFLGVLFNLILSLFAFPYLLKPVLIFLLVSASIATFFMDAYHIMIDKTMIQNVMETDLNESIELLSPGFVIHVLFAGLLPALLVARCPVNYGSLVGGAVSRAVIVVVSVMIIGLIAAGFYQDYASLFRNHRYVRNLIVPVNYLYSLESYAKQWLPAKTLTHQVVGADARLGPLWNNPSDKKAVTVIVVGETARSRNFSINGYERNTTPELAAEDIISFTDFSSCGTSTAVSVPCMFSFQQRSNFDVVTAAYSDNLLDVLQRSGLNVIWRDNNSGCKDVCNRVSHESVSKDTDPVNCTDKECFDMALLANLQQQIDASDRDAVIVLHQKGSHGPAYFERYPKQFQSFSPVCHTNQLQECTQTEIVNAYDNSIRYTDHFLASVIGFLKQHQDQYDGSMLYISDHGESLGENNLYLHGLPYMLAPSDQTHVPFIVWMTEGFQQRFALNRDCLARESGEPFSQDNLTDSVIGLLNVETSAYRPDRDLFNSCRSDQALAAAAMNPTDQNKEI